MKKSSLLVVIVLLAGAASARAEDSFTGTWDTTFGPVTIIQKGRKATGSYYDGKAMLEGRAEGRRLTFTYQETAEGGEGEFELSEDGKSFTGKYRVAGTKKWIEWSGTRK